MREHPVRIEKTGRKRVPAHSPRLSILTNWPAVERKTVRLEFSDEPRHIFVVLTYPTILQKAPNSALPLIFVGSVSLDSFSEPLMRFRKKLLPVVLLLGIGATSACRAEEDRVESNIVYGHGGNEELKLDLIKPTVPIDNGPALILIHGGGWQGGDKADFLNFGKAAAKRGFVCVTVNYRLAPKHRFPAQVEDVKCAVRWLRSQAMELHIDPKRIGAVGGSAGGHLAMLLGTMNPADGLEGEGGHADQPSQVQVVVSLFGPTNLLSEVPLISQEILKVFLNGTKEELTETYRKASPITYVNAGDAPMLLYQGTKDILVPYDQATQMATALTDAGVNGRVELLLGAGHGWGNPELERVNQGTLDFLDQKLKTHNP